jgi:uncharacterized membrane protein YfcA
MDVFPIQQPWFAWVAAAAGVAGAVRGLTGFGSALILVPILSMFLGPVVAVPVLNIVDGVATFLLLPDAMRRCRWSEVIPLFVGALALLPFGVYALRYVDPATLRHVMSVVILGIVACMTVGARYTGSPSRAVCAWPVLRLSIVLMPIYAVGVLLGARGFRIAPERWFRAFALGLIAAVAIVSLVR